MLFAAPPWQTPDDKHWTIKSEFRNFSIDLLSARCAADHLRLQYEPAAIVQALDRDQLEKVISNLIVIIAFVERLEQRLKRLPETAAPHDRQGPGPAEAEHEGAHGGAPK